MTEKQIIHTRAGTVYVRRRQKYQSREYLRSIAPPTKGEMNPSAKITAEIAMAIYLTPGKHAAIAAEHGVTESHVSKVKRKEIWKHIHA